VLKKQIGHFPIKIHEKIIEETKRDHEKIAALLKNEDFHLPDIIKGYDPQEIADVSNLLLRVIKELKEKPQNFINLPRKLMELYLDSVEKAFVEIDELRSVDKKIKVTDEDKKK